MDIMKWVLPLYGIVLAAIGLYLFGIGLWGLVKRRPHVFAARQLMWFMLAIYIPITVQSFVPLFGSWGGNVLFFIVWPFIQTALLILLIFVFWRQTMGYVIFEVSDETFRDALTSALNRLNLPFEETISKIKLIGLDADLNAAVTSWMGTAQIRIKQRQHVKIAKDIANAMNEYYKNNMGKVNNIAFILYLLLGMLMIILVIVLAIFWLGILFGF